MPTDTSECFVYEDMDAPEEAMPRSPDRRGSVVRNSFDFSAESPSRRVSEPLQKLGGFELKLEQELCLTFGQDQIT